MNILATNPASTLLRAIALALLVALGVFLAPAGPAHAAEDDVTWTVRTASNSFGAERTSFSYTINPGSKIDDALVVTNRGATALDLGVYAADGFTTDSGSLDLVVGGAKSVSVGAWVAGASDSITVAPGETVEVPFTLTVPQNATPGDYVGGILTSLVQPDDADGINVDRRLGVKIALRVGGDLKPSLAAEDAHVDWNGGFNPFGGGDATLSYTLHNTGNAVVSAQQVAGLAGPFGWFPMKAGTVDDAPQLLPGEKWTVKVPVSGVAPLVWLAASSSITPAVVDASGSTTSLEPVVASATGWAVPWMLLLIIVVLVALVIVLLRLRKRSATRRKAREDARVQEAVEEALAKSEETSEPSLR